MGVALLVGGDLVRADVERMRDTGMTPEDVAEKGKLVLRRWIERYRPDVLAVEDAYFAQSKGSRPLRRLIQALLTVGRQEGLAVRTYLPMTVRRRVCPEGRPTRRAVARVIAMERFRWLAPYYERDAGKAWWRKRYWTPLFDAVAVGLVCQEELTSKPARRNAA